MASQETDDDVVVLEDSILGRFRNFGEGIQDEALEDEGLEGAEHVSRIFANYVPNYDLNEGVEHPALLSEGAGLANVMSPEITHRLKLTWDLGEIKMSKAQLLAVVYATQANNATYAHNDITFRKGFLLGDGTGVGKTMELAGIVIEGLLNNYFDRVVWVVPNQDLISSAISEVQRMAAANIKDLRCDFFLEVRKENYRCPGIVFLTYSSLSMEKVQKKLEKYLGENFGGMIVLDECHFIKSAFSPVKKSETGTFVMKVQQAHPNARLVYSSATAASETHHLMTLSRLQFWGEGAKYLDPKAFFEDMKSMGVAGLEMLSMDMKRRGVFLSRLISFKDVTVETMDVKLGRDFLEVYSKSCELFLVLLQMLEESLRGEDGYVVQRQRSSFHGDMLRYFANLILTAKIRPVSEAVVDHLETDKSVIITVKHTGESGFKNDGKPFSVLEHILRRIYKTLNIPLGDGMYYVSSESGLRNTSTNQRFDLQEGASSVSNQDIEEKEEEEKEEEDVLEEGPIHLHELNMLAISRDIGRKDDGSEDDEPEDGDEEPDSKRLKLEIEQRAFLLYSLAVQEDVDSYFPREMSPEDFSWSADDVGRTRTTAGAAKLFHEIRPFLPINCLDELILRLSKKLDEDPCAIIANGTGRQFFYVQESEEKSDSEEDDISVWKKVKTKSRDKEIQDFMNKEKRIIIISDASSVGVSLHADRTRTNHQQRVHFILEYPWSPDSLVQTLGRSLRSNSDTTPIYVLPKTTIPSEARFLCVIEERMKQMGAITQGQSKASILDKHLCTNLNSRAAIKAIRAVIASYSANRGHQALMSLIGIVPPITSDLDHITKYVSKIFNRLMMLPMAGQEDFFTKLQTKIGELAEDQAIFSDLTAVDIPAPGFDTDVTLIKNYEWKLNSGSVQMRRFKMERILTYDSLLLKMEKEDLGFYCTPLGAVCYVKRQVENQVHWMYVPYSRDMIKKKLTHNYVKDTSGMGKFYWRREARRLEEPGCMCYRKGFRCDQGICNKRWGTQEINVVCGFIYNIYSEIKRITEEEESQTRFARINWTENGSEKRDIGLLLAENVRKELVRELDLKESKERIAREIAAGKFVGMCDPTV